MIDQKTLFLKLPLPHLENELSDDCLRLKASLTALDDNAADLAGQIRQTREAQQQGEQARQAVVERVVDVEAAVAASASLLGSVISMLAADGYVPAGAVPADGAEYTRAQFPDLYDHYLTGASPKLLTCAYGDFAGQVAATGNCAKFAVNPGAQTFKVPLLKDGDSITQAASAREMGKSVEAGLPNITGEIAAYDFNGDGYAHSGAFQEKTRYKTTAQGGTILRVDEIAASLDASRCSPVYGNSATVTPEQVRLRHFVVVASGQSKTSTFDWSNYMAALSGKANRDLSNVTDSRYLLLQKLTGDVTVHVATTGQDATADGSQARPFKTVNAAIRYATNTYFLSIYNIIIQVAAGTYPERIYLLPYLASGGRIFIRGAGQEKTIIDGTVGKEPLVWTMGVYTAVPYTLQDMCLVSPNERFGRCVHVCAGGEVEGMNLRLISSALNGHLIIADGGKYIIQGPHWGELRESTCEAALTAFNSGVIFQWGDVDVNGKVIRATIYCLNAGTFERSWERQPSFTGTVEGKKFYIEFNAVLRTGTNAGLNFFPGSEQGWSSSGAQYN